jgi:hypothetical protein
MMRAAAQQALECLWCLQLFWCVRLRRRVLPQGEKCSSEIYDTLPIQLERFDRRSPGRCQTHDEGKIAVPGEMLSPDIPPWMIERGRPTTYGIPPLRLGILVIIAALAGKRQIVEHRLAATTPRNDVLYREGLDGEASLATAVFTAVSRALDHRLTFCRTNGSISGTAAAQCRDPSSAWGAVSDGHEPAQPGILVGALPHLPSVRSYAVAHRTPGVTASPPCALR